MNQDLKYLRYRMEETKTESNDMLEGDFPNFRSKFFSNDVPRLLNKRSECLSKVENLRQKRVGLGPKADEIYVEKIQDDFFKNQRDESDKAKRVSEATIDFAKSKTKSYMSSVKRIEAENCEKECELQQKFPYSGDKKGKTIEQTFKKYENRENSRLKRMRVVYGVASTELAKHRRIAEEHELEKTKAIIHKSAHAICSQILDDFILKKEEKTDYDERYKQVSRFCSLSVTNMNEDLLIALTEEAVPRGKLVDVYSEKLKLHYKSKEDTIMAQCQVGLDEYLSFMRKNAKDEGKFKMDAN